MAEAELRVGDLVTLQRGTTYEGALVGEDGPALLGLGSIEPGGGFRATHFKTFGGACPTKIMVASGELFVALKGATKDGSMVGSIARVPSWLQGGGRLTQDTARLDFTDAGRGHESYLYWMLRTPQYRAYCAGRITGSASASFSRDDFLNYRFPAPSPSRIRVVETLGAVDDKIELNRRLSETVEAIARAQFRSWFVDFDPVRAKALGRDPGLTQYLLDLFPDGLVASELGEIPEGWGLQYVADLATLDKGLSYKGEFLGEAGMPMVSLGCLVGRGRFAEAAIKHYSGEFKDRHVVRPRDLVIANTDLTQKRDVLGSPALIPQRAGFDRLLFTHHVYAARFLDRQESWKLFVYYALLQNDFRDRAVGYATGTTVLGLPREAILGLALVAPPQALVAAFSTMATTILERQWKAAEESASLAKLRDALLLRLSRGDKRSPMGSGHGE